MDLIEELDKIPIIPEVEQAITSLMDSETITCTAFGGETWYETVEGERVIFQEPSGDTDVDETFDDEEEDNLIPRISGMPVMTLFIYPMKNQEWWMSLSMEIPLDSEEEDVPSLYFMFRQSLFAPLFHMESEVDGIISLERYIGMDAVMAARLISYYIRYYDYESKIPDCIR